MGKIHTRGGAILRLSLAAAAASCGGGPGDAPDGPAEWTLALAETTEIRDVGTVLPPSATRQPMTLVVDLVVSGDDRTDLSLEQVYSLAVAADGTLYALDHAARQVKSFSADGDYSGAWGEAGREAGQFFAPSEVVVAGGEVVVVDPGIGRLSRWSGGGDHLADASDPIFMDFNGVVGLESGDLAVTYVLKQQLDEQESLSIVTLAGEELRRYLLLPAEQAGDGPFWPRPVFAATPEGRLYVTAAAEYQVHVFEPAGAQPFAIRAEWPRIPATDEAIGRSLERTRRAGRAMSRNVDASDVGEVPSHFPALASLEVDGRGNLYVFPFVEDDGTASAFPVDVFSPEGTLLFTASLPFQSWNAQRGEFIYRVEEDPETGTPRLVRYRLGPPRS